ncbi:hypothetical protein AC578_134 [Pseudocercospora eumusae]|uniref:Uncharacterized protein n=1 Tax=Pseudocercospora eumusae TaxID=321146 RepID=A0A139GXX8_9PEZI|nr:hypothetical protein AC578_134 [Pseudocercospora eumusae]
MRGYHHKPLDLAAAMFKEVRELSVQYHWPYILQVLEEKYQTACAVFDEWKGSPPAYRTIYKDAGHDAAVFDLFRRGGWAVVSMSHTAQPSRIKFRKETIQ